MSVPFLSAGILGRKGEANPMRCSRASSSAMGAYHMHGRSCRSVAETDCYPNGGCDGRGGEIRSSGNLLDNRCCIAALEIILFASARKWKWGM